MAKRIALIFAALIFLVASFQTRADQPDPARQEYDAAIEKARKEFDQRVQAATDQYIAKLKVEMSVATKSGNLDRAIELRGKLAALTAREGHLVNLLSLVDPARDSVAGTWAVTNGALVSDLGEYSRLQFPYHPPEEYDFEIEFSRIEGNNEAAQIMAKSNANFAWVIGGYDNTVFGLTDVNGKMPGDNATGVRVKQCLENGKIYRSVVKVRNNKVESFLDGKLTSQFKSDYKDLSLHLGDMKLKDPLALGLWTFKSKVQFRKITVLEVTGEGEIIQRK